MQAIIVRWCDLIGVTNEGSIQVATGVVSGGAALFVAYAAFVIVGAAIGVAVNETLRGRRCAVHRMNPRVEATSYARSQPGFRQKGTARRHARQRRVQRFKKA
jgi:hypothetical protein